MSSSVSNLSLDFRTLTYLTVVDENLRCPICHSPLIEPATTKCRHTFCSDCIANALAISLTCPVDRYPLKPEDVSAAPIMIANLVNDLVVLCPNSALGCMATMPRPLVGGHLKEDCGFVTSECPGCEERILRRDLHTECMHQQVECRHCAAMVRQLEMEVRNYSAELHWPRLPDPESRIPMSAAQRVLSALRARVFSVRNRHPPNSMRRGSGGVRLV